VDGLFARMQQLPICFLFVFAGLGLARAEAAELDAQKFAKVQAAYIYNLARFVQWPKQAAGTFHICLLGQVQQLLLQQLQQGVKGKTIHTLPVQIDVITQAALQADPAGLGLQHCQVLYLTQHPDDHGFANLPQLSARHILRIASPELRQNSYSQVDLVLEKDRIQLYLNGQSLQQSGLQVSPALLSIARQRSKS